jgi:nucleoid-associated protein YgaU
MRHVLKYLLVLAVLMSGFYMARMFRVPQPTEPGGGTATENSVTDVPAASDGMGARPAPDGLPVAALRDDDRTSPAVVDELAKIDHRQTIQRLEAEAGRRALESRPAVRRERAPQQNGPQAEEDGRTSKATRRDGARDKSIPDLAIDYEPRLDPLEESLQPGTNRVESYTRSGSRNAAQPGDEQEQNSRTRRHRIVEGDTLQQLAESYLGNRDRYLELYEANDDVLFHPQLLPIGVEIVVHDPDDTPLIDEDEDADDLASQADPWRDSEGTQYGVEQTYSPWGDY